MINKGVPSIVCKILAQEKKMKDLEFDFISTNEGAPFNELLNNVTVLSISVSRSFFVLRNK